MRLTTLLAGAAALAITLSSAAPAFALCPICTPSVRLNSGLAGCFAGRADEALAELAGSKNPYVVIDLGDCSSRDSLPTGNAQPDSPRLDTKFIADAEGIKCLSDQIAAADDTTLDPSRLFDLAKDCPAQ